MCEEERRRDQIGLKNSSNVVLHIVWVQRLVKSDMISVGKTLEYEVLSSFIILPLIVVDYHAEICDNSVPYCLI